MFLVKGGEDLRLDQRIEQVSVALGYAGQSVSLWVRDKDLKGIALWPAQLVFLNVFFFFFNLNFNFYSRHLLL